MQYEIVFKSDRLFMLYLPLSKVLLLLKLLGRRLLGTGTGAPQMDQRLLTNTWPKQGTTVNIHANNNKN